MKMEERVSKFLAGEATADEAREVREWRSASEENARAFLEMKTAWTASEQQRQPPAQLMESILTGGDRQMLQVVPLWEQKPFRLAAAILILVGLGMLVLTLSNEKPPFGQVVDQLTELNLPDGSVVTLQRGSKLDIPGFDSTREAYLTGKAFFEVETDQSKPFTVRTEGAVIQVLGTSFVVRSRESRTTEVMVTSGEVSLAQNPVAFSGKSMKVQLKAGEMGRLAIGQKGIQKKSINDENLLAWKTQVITFRRHTLREVAAILEDVYGVALSFDNPELGRCQLSAQFKSKPADEVVGIIAETFGLTFERHGGRFVLKGEGCR